MFKTKVNLHKFICKKALNEECSELEIVRKYGFENIFSECDDGSMNMKELTITNQIRDKVIIRELIQIVRDFQNVILLKGLWYSEKYYEHQEMRIFGDIDLYICDDQFIDFDIAMKKNGYKRLRENIPVPNKFYFYYDIYDNIKLSWGILDHYVYEKKGYLLPEVEAHIYLLPLYQYPLIPYKEIFSRKKQIVLQGKLQINVLECNDDFLYAVCHMCKHLVHSIISMEEMAETEWTFNAGKYVYDIASMIDAGELDWNIVMERAKQWDVLQDLLVAFRMIKFFFPDTIPEKVLNQIISLVKKDRQRGLYKSLLRDLGLADASIFFDGKIFDFINANQSNPYCEEIEIYHRDRLQQAVTILWSEWGTLFSEWDYNYWYLIYEPKRNGNIVPYASIQCPLYGIHAITFLLDKEKGIVSRNVKYEHRKPADWLKSICVETNFKGQYIIKVSFAGLGLNSQNLESIICQAGLLLLNEDNEVVDRISLFGKGYYHFYDMGILRLK